MVYPASREMLPAPLEAARRGRRARDVRFQAGERSGDPRESGKGGGWPADLPGPPLDLESSGRKPLGPVPPELDGARLDRVLARLLPETSRTRAQEWIKDGGVRVDGARVRRPAHPVAAGAEVELEDVARSRVRAGAPEGADFRVVHEDEWLIVVDKPAGMVVHPSTVVRGGTVSELAEERFGPLPAPQGEDRPGVVHRLDSETSGLLVLARTEEVGAELVRQFHDREVEKLYLALVHGDPRFDADWIEAPIGRSERHPERMSVLPEGEGREASTFYEVRERFGVAALVACRPRTGRTHQIRVHLASIEHPVVGDKLYRGKRGAKHTLPEGAPPMRRHALHAFRLGFHHPHRGEPVAFEAPLHEDMEALVRWLRDRPASV